ncbi:SMP-30/gluconolactonase/LRE family protein [Saccharothrix longispora]|uniref:SMP-30/gluconolactonase/LRE family protein n=1 Tax=Saccharothrix longispora TaxID=33920 RepID=UPI0028FDA15F|nr:SMP-30/gluconolactonase/LRE family protein [Saccharothrix longispora]MBY8849223.1 SMP-30/gluconolactonase/LRE family protein [Saccharothrix sp. MB29]MDU0293986.1 SMP-30/gluconolactonase/LRE family protein [Saccharothrix longispora]
MADTTVLREGLRFGEGPRRGPDGRLFYSDFYEREVRALDLDTGAEEVVCAVPGQPSGLGWLPDGRLLVVSMRDRRVLRLEDGDLVEHADLGDIATFHANDMLVDAHGRAYVGNFGFDLHGLIAEAGGEAPLLEPGWEPPGATLALVRPDGTVSRAAEDLKFPNGMGLLPDGRLLVAETLAFGLTAFDVADDGTLSGRTPWAALREHGIAPDGIAVDADGGAWVAPALQACAFRVEEGGAVTHRVATSQPCFAVAVVGDRLVCCTAPTSQPEVVAGAHLGKLEVFDLRGTPGNA